MIKTEFLVVGDREFIKTYSDEGFMIERDGVRYSEAIDPVGFGRTYAETDEPIEVPEEENPEELDEITDEESNYEY